MKRFHRRHLFGILGEESFSPAFICLHPSSGLTTLKTTTAEKLF
jgi:hypothetical protein